MYTAADNVLLSCTSSKNLPLPSFLHMHQEACHKEAIDCSNPLLGEKSSWIWGIVDEVTFNVQLGQITVTLIDETSLTLPIQHACQTMLDLVLVQVQLSFAAAAAQPSPVPSPRMTTRPATQTTTRNRSPSAILSALLSPILATQTPVPTTTTTTTPPPNPAKMHRRQARSILVDAYRSFILPALRQRLPSTFIMWSLQGEQTRKRQEWESVRSSVDEILTKAGQQPVGSSLTRIKTYRSLTRQASYFSSASSLDSPYASSSSSDSESSPSTPTGSISSFEQAFSSAPVSPLAHLSSLPPCSALSANYSTTYAALVAQLAALASRLATIQKLMTSVEKEQGRRKWLEGLEASRQVDKATRRAWSNRACRTGCIESHGISQPTRPSPLATSHTMMLMTAQGPTTTDSSSPGSDSELADMEDSSDEDVFSPKGPIRPLFTSSLFTASSHTTLSSLPTPGLVASSSSIDSHSSCDTDSDDSDMLPHHPASTMDTPSSPYAACAAPPRRLSLENNAGTPSLEKLKSRRPSLETMDLDVGRYRIVSASMIDSDDDANEAGGQDNTANMLRPGAAMIIHGARRSTKWGGEPVEAWNGGVAIVR